MKHVTKRAVDPVTGCPRHPRYQVKRRPRSDCPICHYLWQGKQEREVGKQPRIDVFKLSKEMGL